MPAQMVSVPFGSTRVNRLMPKMGPQNFKTYGLAMPLATHWRKATCEETGCDAYLKGWVTTLDLSTPEGQFHAETIKNDKTRKYSVQRVSVAVAKYVYPPGNRCFRESQHRLPLERPARLYVADGDWRGNPRRTPVRVHQRAEDWVEDFSLHQDTLKTAIERG